MAWADLRAVSEPSTLTFEPPDPGAGMGVPLSDYLRVIAARAVELPGVIPAAARYFEGEPEDQLDRESLRANQYMQEQLRAASASVMQGAAPDTQRLLASTVASRDFMAQPFSWTFLQLANTVPDVAAAVVAGAVSGGTIPALVAAGAASGTLSAADFLSTAQRSVDEDTDEGLKKRSVLYRGYRNAGMPEDQARIRMQQDMTTYQAPILFALGIATGALGNPGQVLRATGVAQAPGRAAGRGLTRRVGEEALIGGGTEFAQSAGENIAAQTGAVTAGFQPGVDIQEALIAGASGALPGALLGGVTGIPRGREPQPVAPGQAGAAGAQPLVPPGGARALPVGRSRFPAGPAAPPPVQGPPRRPYAPPGPPTGPARPSPAGREPVEAAPLVRAGQEPPERPLVRPAGVTDEEWLQMQQDELLLNRQRFAGTAPPTAGALAGAPLPSVVTGSLDPRAPTVLNRIANVPGGPASPSRIGLPGAELGDENLGVAPPERFPPSQKYLRGIALPPGRAQPVTGRTGPVIDPRAGALPVGRRAGAGPGYNPRPIAAGLGPSPEQRLALAQGQGLDLFGRPTGPQPAQGPLQGGLTTAPQGEVPGPQPIQLPDVSLRAPGGGFRGPADPSLLPAPDATQRGMQLTTPPRPDAEQLQLPDVPRPPPPVSAALTPIPRERALVPGAQRPTPGTPTGALAPAARPTLVRPNERQYPPTGLPRPDATQLTLPGVEPSPSEPERLVTFLLDRAGADEDHFAFLVDYFWKLPDEELNAELARKRDQTDPNQLLELVALLAVRRRIDGTTPGAGKPSPDSKLTGLEPGTAREPLDVAPRPGALAAFVKPSFLSPEALQFLEDAEENAFRQMEENAYQTEQEELRQAKGIKAAEQGIRGEDVERVKLQYKRKDPKWVKEREAEDDRTVQMFEAHREDKWEPLASKLAQNPGEKAKSFQARVLQQFRREMLPRFESLVADAEKRNIKPRGRIEEETLRETMWLSEVRRVHKLLRDGGMTAEKADEVYRFWDNELEAYKGNWAPIEESRREAGERMRGRRPSTDQTIAGEEGAEALDPRLQGRTMPGEILPDEAPPLGGWAVTQEVGEEQYAPSIYGMVPGGTRKHLPGGELEKPEAAETPDLAVALPPSPRLAADIAKHPTEAPEPLGRKQVPGRKKPVKVERLLEVSRRAKAEPPEGQVTRRLDESEKEFRARKAQAEGRQVEVDEAERQRLLRVRAKEVAAERRAKAAKGVELPKEKPEPKQREKPSGVEEEEREREREPEAEQREGLEKLTVGVREEEARAEEEALPGLRGERWRGAVEVEEDVTPLTDVVRDVIKTVEGVVRDLQEKPPRVGAEKQKSIVAKLPDVRKALKLLREAVRKLELDPGLQTQLRRIAGQIRGEHPLPMLPVAQSLLKEFRALLPQRSLSGKAIDGVLDKLTSLGRKPGISPALPATLKAKGKALEAEKKARREALEAAKLAKPEAEPVPPRTTQYLTEPYEHPRHKQLMKTPVGRAELRGRRDFFAGRTKNPLGGLKFGRAWQKGFDEARAEGAVVTRHKAELAKKGPITTEAPALTAALEAKQAGRKLGEPQLTHGEPSLLLYTGAAWELPGPATKRGKQKLAAEEAKVDKNPSPAQIREGNYTKGHLSIEGLRISLETARQALRTLKGGVKVRTRYAYGYFVGTKSTDGEQIDVWLGPHAFPGSVRLKKPRVGGEMPVTKLTLDTKQQFPVVVISQLNAAGAFDENKVMLGFANVEAALDAYAANYPDVGRSRILDYRPMTMAEFKKWLGSPNSRKPVAQVGKSGLFQGYLQRGILRSITEGDPEVLRGWAEVSEDYGVRLENAGIAPARFDEMVTDDFLAAAKANLSNMPPQLRKQAERLVDRITQLARSVPTFVLSTAEFDALFPEEANSDGFYDSGHDYLVIRHEGATAQTVIHEAAHTAFTRAVHGDPALQAEMEALLEAARDEAERTGFTHYGLNDIDELIAEAFGKPEFAGFLAGVRSPLGSLWTRFWRAVGRVFGFTRPGDASVLADIFSRLQAVQSSPRGAAPTGFMSSLGASRERTMPRKQRALLNELRAEQGPPNLLRSPRDFGAALAQHIPESLGGTARQGQTGVPWFVSLRGTDELAQLLKTLPDSKEAARAGRDASNALEQTRVTVDDITREFEPSLTRFYELEKQWKGRPEWEAFVTLLHDETMYGVWADRTLADQFPKKTTQNAQARERHADLAARFKVMPEELKAARKQAAALYEDMQRRVRDAIGANRLNVLAKKGTVLSPAVLERILDGEETAHDIAALGQDVIDDIYAAHAVTTLRGPYYPFIRRGNWVLNAKVKLKPPLAGLQGKLVAGTDNVYEFAGPRAKEHAENYAAGQELKSFVRGIWVDKNTGSEYGRDADGKDVRISPSDTDAEHRWRVRVQNQHTEFFDGETAGQIRADELENNGNFYEVRGIEAKRFREAALDWRTAGASQLQNTDFERFLARLKKNERFLAMPEHLQNAFVQQMWQAALQSMGATRMAARFMPRKYVQGVSREFTRNMADYAKATASTLANFKHQPALDDALKRLEASKQGDAKVSSAAKSVIVNELLQRGRASVIAQEPGRADGIIRRLAQLAFTYFLGSPSYTLNNLLQTTVAWSTLAGTYGPGMATKLMWKAYDDVAALKMLGTSLKATKERALGRAGADYFEQLIIGKEISAVEKTMLRRLRELGVLGAGTGLEIERLIQSPTDTALGKFDASLYYMTELARELPRASEMINRSVVALSSFRAEMARTGGDVDASTLKAQEVTNLTQGLYSASDAAPIFNSRGGQLTLVFRKFGALMYGLLGHQIGRIIRNANPDDRKEALKSLGYLMGVTTVMAGTLGLPTDVFKALLGGLNAAGVTEYTWGDFQNWQRQVAAELFGAKGGEMLTRGFSRLLGIDLSQRVGLEGLLFHGEPRTYEEHDITSFIYENIAGAPLAMTFDMIGGANQLFSGNVVEAAQKLTPLKILRDAATTWQETTVGKKTPAGYVVHPPSGLGQGLARVLGYTPAAKAEMTEARNYFFRSSSRLSENRDDYMHRWLEATGSERSRLWVEIVEWNRDQEPGARLSRADLNDYKKRRKSEEAPFGMRLTDVNRPIFEGLAGPYPSMAVH